MINNIINDPNCNCSIIITSIGIANCVHLISISMAYIVIFRDRDSIFKMRRGWVLTKIGGTAMVPGGGHRVQ